MGDLLNVVVTIIGEPAAGSTNYLGVTAEPHWEISHANLQAQIRAAVVRHCNTHGTGGFTVFVDEINS